MNTQSLPASANCVLHNRGQCGLLRGSFSRQHAFSQQATFQNRTLRPARLAVKAAGDDDDFESKLTRLQSRRKPEKKQESSGQPKNPKYDFSGEELHFESAPHRGDLATNVALGTTLVWLPLTIAAIGRALFVKYRFTDKRLSVITSAPWKNEQLDAAYQEVRDVQTVGRGIGLWGDMVVTLKNNDKIELRSLPQFLELKKYVLERRDALISPSSAGVAKGLNKLSGSSKPASSKGF